MKKKKKGRLAKRKIFYLLVILLVFLVELGKMDDSKKINYLLPDQGIREEKILEAQGREYYVNIRGRDRTKPILVFLHGGPGVPMTNSMRRYQVPFEDDFVVVNWDQFYSGKSYSLNKNRKIITMEESVEDMDILIGKLKRDLDNDDLVLVGFSYGSILGMEYVNKYEDHISGYIGVAQSTNYDRENLAGYKRAKDLSKNFFSQSILSSTIRRLEKGKRPSFNLSSSLIKYFKLGYEKRLNLFENFWYTVTSSNYSIKDNLSLLATQLNRSQTSLKKFMKEDFDIEKRYEYQIPLVFISGEYDYLSSKDLVKDYYERLNTSYKDFVLLKGVGHSPFKEDPRQTYLSIKEEVEKILKSYK